MLAGILAVKVCGADAPKKLSTTDIKVVANSYLVQTGATVNISIDSDLKANVDRASGMGGFAPEYQWVKNGSEIFGATKSAFAITNVSFADVGEYMLLLSGAFPANSGPVYVSVYYLFSTNSNGGVLTAPIGDFTIGSDSACGGTGFDRYKAYGLFYGPNASPQSGTFQNTSASSKLDLTTCTNANNSGLDTAIKLQGNWLGMPEVACNNDDPNCAIGSLLSTVTNFVLSTNSGSNTNSYRATVYFKKATLGTSNTVTFRWYYHN